uniref:Arpin n=1 Tax=Latimeria chalumnae TaxID=7897 RepID=H2ZUE3_LATCH
MAEVEAKGQTDRMSVEDLRRVVNKAELEKVTGRHAPSQAVAFWLSEAEMEKMELEMGTELRLKTKGDGPFILSLAKLDGGTVTKSNFAGDEAAGASWTNKIMSNKCQYEPNLEPRGQGDGAEDCEWVIKTNKLFFCVFLMNQFKKASRGK